MADDGEMGQIINAIGDQRTRTILADINKEPQSAKELAESLDFSLATIYRRLEILEEHDLITDKTVIADDGNHYKLYNCNLNSIVISLDEDTYNTRILRQESLPDRFLKLWNDLQPV